MAIEKITLFSCFLKQYLSRNQFITSMDRRDFIEKSALAAGGILLSASGAEALANNMAFLMKATGGKPAPGRGDEPWEPMHFIR